MENITHPYDYDKNRHMNFLTEQLAKAEAQINVLRDLLTRTKQAHEAEVIDFYMVEVNEDESAKSFRGFSITERYYISLRAVLYELNILLERQMQLLTLEAWMFSNRPKDKVNYEDTGIDTDIIIDDSKRYELISDLKWAELVKLFEGYYHIKLEEINLYKEVIQVRKIVNSLKHADGRKDTRKQPPPASLLELFDTTYMIEHDLVAKSIENLHGFLSAAYEFVLKQKSSVGLK
jgi:hypothetical protein